MKNQTTDSYHDVSEKEILNHKSSDTATSTHDTKNSSSINPTIDMECSPKKSTNISQGIEVSTMQIDSVTTAVRLSFLVNILLLAAKVVAFVLTFSYALIASMIDSILDLVSQVIIFMTEHKVRTKGEDIKYPAGRTRLEPVGILTVSVLMTMLSVTVIRESVQALVLKTHSVELTTASVLLITAVIILKFLLWIYCRRFKENPIASALAQDHINDVGSNTITLAVMLIAGSFHHLSWLDPTGAIIISFYIIWSWYITGKDEVKKLVGRRAPDDTLDELRKICEDHHPEAALDVLLGYHIGRNILVEVEMIMQKETTLEKSHDVCVDLQFKLEKFGYVERAFVHCDYMHRGYSEHKSPTLEDEFFTRNDEVV